MCILNAFKLWSVGQGHVRQLDFREQLMHELMKQLPPGHKPHRASRRPKAAHSLAKDHYPEHTESRGDCVACSSRSGQRATSRIICAECGVHLCIGACFSLYHSDA